MFLSDTVGSQHNTELPNTGLSLNPPLFPGPDGAESEGLPEVHEGDHGRGGAAQDVAGGGASQWWSPSTSTPRHPDHQEEEPEPLALRGELHQLHPLALLQRGGQEAGPVSGRGPKQVR